MSNASDFPPVERGLSTMYLKLRKWSETEGGRRKKSATKKERKNWGFQPRAHRPEK